MARQVFARRTGLKKWIFSSILISVVFLMFLGGRNTNEISSSPTSLISADKYVVLSCSTPSDLRGFDYSFYLPLTAMSWNRLGFKSIVIIVGNQSEWNEHLVLSHVLDNVAQQNATVIFMEGPLHKRVTIGQIVRLFASHLLEFPGKPEDYLITADADLWPLKASVVNMPDEFELLLAHSHCCGTFEHRGREYRMLPMSYIGARVSTWRQIMDFSSTLDKNQSEEMLKYFEAEFGPRVHAPNVKRDSNQWYYDQYMISLKIDNWISKYGNEKVLEVSEETFDRMDRTKWEYFPFYSDSRKQFNSYDDAHLPLTGYKAIPWMSFQVLLRLMYGNKSREKVRWANKYATLYHKKMVKLRLI